MAPGLLQFKLRCCKLILVAVATRLYVDLAEEALKRPLRSGRVVLLRSMATGVESFTAGNLLRTWGALQYSSTSSIEA
jgi:hypothetical protein